jgi:hypothetical protein
MHSISTRATVHGRRRNLTRFGATAAGVFALAAATAQIASAASVPTVSVQYPSYNVTVNGAPITVQVTVANPATTPANVSFLSVATGCDTNTALLTPTAAGAATGAGICPSGDGDPTFAAPTISVDPNSPSCQSATFAALPGHDTNISWTVGTAPLTGMAGTNFCIFDVKLNPVALPQSSFVYFAASAAMTDTASQSAASAPITSTIYVNAAPITTPPVTPPVTPPHNFTPPATHSERHETHRCGPDSPNNGNGNLGYGNNGNGNVGNCNNGNGNTGDDNSGNGNGDPHEHGDI